MAGNFKPATKFFTSRGRLEQQKQQNECSNKAIFHEETRQMFVYVHTYAVAPVDVFFAFVTALVLLFLLL